MTLAMRNRHDMLSELHLDTLQNEQQSNKTMQVSTKKLLIYELMD